MLVTARPSWFKDTEDYMQKVGGISAGSKMLATIQCSLGVTSDITGF